MGDSDAADIGAIPDIVRAGIGTSGVTLTPWRSSVSGQALDNVAVCDQAADPSSGGYGNGRDGRIFRIEGDLGVVPADYRFDASA